MSNVPLDDALSPADAALLRRMGTAAHEAGAHLWLVGGSVRDALLGRPVLDLDLTSEAPAAGLAPVLARAAGGQVSAHSRFGTVKLRLDGRTIDLATVRSETYAHPGALPAVGPGDMRSDLARRDISINAMAASLAPADFGALLDTEGGLKDLRAGLVRVLHERSLQDDATRILRVVRYGARLRFRIDRRTRRWMRRDAGWLDAVSPARVRREIERTLEEDEAARTLLATHRLGVLAAVHPALDGTTIAAALRRAARRHLRGVALLGVLLCGLAPEEARSVGARLALTRRQTHVAEHARRLASEPSPTGGAPAEALEAAAAAAADPGVRRALTRHLRSPGADLLSGADLLAAGVPEGPEVGRLLRALDTAARAGTIRSRRGALGWLARERAS
ncbi:MAG: CCA tRNA nucleotidyltransferase [Chloroflexi bacterium]|nr:CCA tRNA nucleotidyltransferase [Chloroflexota bacterium]